MFTCILYFVMLWTSDEALRKLQTGQIFDQANPCENLAIWQI